MFVRSKSLGEQSAPSRGSAHVQDAVYREVARSRRSGSPLSVVVLTVPLSARRLVGRPLTRHEERTAVLVRRYDQVVVKGPARIVVVAPDASAQGAAALADRLRTRLGVKVGAASFPDDGSGADELLALAVQRARIVLPDVAPTSGPASTGTPGSGVPRPRGAGQ